MILNCYHYRHYSFIIDIKMIFCTVLGGGKDGVCGGEDLRKNTVVFEHGCCVF